MSPGLSRRLGGVSVSRSDSGTRVPLGGTGGRATKVPLFRRV